jgi:hypothetical protein
MAMSLSIKTQSFAVPENQEWLSSAHGTQSMDSVTLDAALCVAKFATGLIPSGIPLKKQGSGKYAPAISTDTTYDGHLFVTVDLTLGGTVAAGSAVDTPSSLLWTGEVIVSKITSYAGTVVIAAGDVAKCPLFRYV